jgi:uncharacterized Zn finger protein
VESYSPIVKKILPYYCPICYTTKLIKVKGTKRTVECKKCGLRITKKNQKIKQKIWKNPRREITYSFLESLETITV